MATTRASVCHAEMAYFSRAGHWISPQDRCLRRQQSLGDVVQDGHVQLLVYLTILMQTASPMPCVYFVCGLNTKAAMSSHPSMRCQ